MQEVFDRLYADSKNGNNFYKLYEIITSKQNIRLAYRNIKTNSGSTTAGVDGKTIKDIQKCSEQYVIQKIRNKLNNYQPQPVKRVYIPKPGSDKTRPLGIPTIWDRLVQQCILQVLEPVCEPKFYNHSYGFRQNRSCEHAISRVVTLINLARHYYCVDIDIKGFFDNVNHGKLLKQMWTLGIRDKRVLSIISKMLKAEIYGEGIPTRGTPQGGIISPLLANIVLNELDWWVESQWADNPVAVARGRNRQLGGNTVFDKSHGYRAMRTTRLKEMHIVRYADDFRIFCQNKDSAERTLIAVTKWLKERLRLDVSPEKTQVVNLNKHYSEFLGIKMRLTKKKNKLVVQSRVSEKAVKRIKTEAKQKIKNIARPPKGMTEARAILNYNAFVMGEHNYYQMATGVSLDFRDIGYELTRTMKRLGDRLKKEPKDNIGGAVVDRYSCSKLMRYIKNLPVAPISYVRTKAPMCKKRSIQKYTPEGRAEIHENLGFDTKMLRALLRQEVHEQSAAYADNRLSLFCAQYGKCAVTGQVFESLGDIHCHHKLPKNRGGRDNYQNLIIVRESVHILIHATSESTIAKCLSELSLNKRQLAKLNKLRKEAGNPPVSA